MEITGQNFRIRETIYLTNIRNFTIFSKRWLHRCMGNCIGEFLEIIRRSKEFTTLKCLRFLNCYTFNMTSFNPYLVLCISFIMDSKKFLHKFLLNADFDRSYFKTSVTKTSRAISNINQTSRMWKINSQYLVKSKWAFRDLGADCLIFKILCVSWRKVCIFRSTYFNLGHYVTAWPINIYLVQSISYAQSNLDLN